jgi:hypothetical protein
MTGWRNICRILSPSPCRPSQRHRRCRGTLWKGGEESKRDKTKRPEDFITGSFASDDIWVLAGVVLALDVIHLDDARLVGVEDLREASRQLTSGGGTE